MLFEIDECAAQSNYNEMMGPLKQVLQPSNDDENSDNDVCLTVIVF